MLCHSCCFGNRNGSVLLYREGETKEVLGWKKKIVGGSYSNLSEPGFDPGTCGLWAHHASAAPLWFGGFLMEKIQHIV